MSVEAISCVWHGSKQSSGNLLVLLAMADYADVNGVCWPSLNTLAKKCRMTDRNVQFCVHDLVKSGEIERLKVGSGKESSRYKINLKGLRKDFPPTHEMGFVGSRNGLRGRDEVGFVQTVIEPSTNRTPIVPKGGTEDLLLQSVDTIKNGARIPPQLDNQKFRAAWDEYSAYRKESKKRNGDFGPIAQKRLLNTLSERPEQAVPALTECINRGWRGFSWEYLDNIRKTIRNQSQDVIL
jgi:Helix-turn-helix domain